MSNPKRLRAIIMGFERQGARIKETKSGYVIYPPDGGQPFAMHGTESDVRAERNTKARAARAGLKWPG